MCSAICFPIKQPGLYCTRVWEVACTFKCVITHTLRLNVTYDSQVLEGWFWQGRGPNHPPTTPPTTFSHLPQVTNMPKDKVSEWEYVTVAEPGGDEKLPPVI